MIFSIIVGLLNRSLTLMIKILIASTTNSKIILTNHNNENDNGIGSNCISVQLLFYILVSILNLFKNFLCKNFFKEKIKIKQ